MLRVGARAHEPVPEAREAGEPSGTGDNRSMPNPLPELSSLAATLDDLTRRVSVMAEGSAAGDETLSAELFEIERDLRTAARRLDRLLTESPTRP